MTDNKLPVKVLILVGVLLINFSVYGQSSGLGIRGGIDRGFEYNNEFGQGNLKGLHAGVYARLDFVGGLFSLQPEIIYGRRTFSAGEGVYVFPGTKEAFSDYRHTYNFIDVPVFLRINVTQGLHFLAGPQVSSLLYSREHYYEPSGADFSLRHSGYRNHLDLFGMAGIGYEFRDGFNIGFRYGWGLGRIYGLNNYENGNLLYDRQGQFTLGYTFGGRGDIKSR